MAGDLTIYGKRNNVLLLRKEFGKKVVRRINLNSEAVLSSPFYYLKSNDVIYIEPSKNKVASVSQGRELLPIIFSGLSFLTIILDRVFR
jgi:polysaccharide export outer membrane protein